MDNKKININGAPGQYEITILEGKTSKPLERKAHFATGAITAPYDFFSMKHKHESLSCFLCSYSLEKMSIEFIEDHEEEASGATIEGILLISPTLVRLGLLNNGSAKPMSGKDLASLLKFNRSLFRDKTECMQLVSTLRDFQAKVNTSLQDSDDQQGNKTLMFAQNVSHNLKLTFTLETRIFTHETEKRAFEVEVMFDIRDRAVSFWLESIELNEIITETSETIIKNEVAKFIKDGVTTIQL